MSAANTSLSYVDAHGATITLPPGAAGNYADVKHELLGAITRLLCAAGEGEIDLADEDHRTFRWTLNALVHEVGALVPVMKTDASSKATGRAKA